MINSRMNWVSSQVLLLIFTATCLSAELDRLDNYVEWGIYRGDKKGNQFAELAQINAANVHRLRPVWEYHTGDAGERTSTYANPIMIDGRVYVSTPSLNAACINAETGEEIWFFDSSKHNANQQVLRGRNRGVVYWEGEQGRRIFVFVRHRRAGKIRTVAQGLIVPVARPARPDLAREASVSRHLPPGPQK